MFNARMLTCCLVDQRCVLHALWGFHLQRGSLYECLYLEGDEGVVFD